MVIINIKQELIEKVKLWKQLLLMAFQINTLILKKK